MSDERISRTDDPAIRLAIDPTPTDEELAAIVGALAVRRSQIATSDRAGIAKVPAPSRWALAGRRDAMRGGVRNEREGGHCPCLMHLD